MYLTTNSSRRCEKLDIAVIIQKEDLKPKSICLELLSRAHSRKKKNFGPATISKKGYYAGGGIAWMNGPPLRYDIVNDWFELLDGWENESGF